MSNYKSFNCFGETRTMNNGQKCTCVAYRNSRDIDVQFEDGTIVTNKTKQNFVKGMIKNPKYVGQSKADCTGDTRIMNNGQKCTCIAYRNYYSIDVQFEDGTIVTNKSKQAFIDGEIGNLKSEKAKNRFQNHDLKKIVSCVGEIRTMNNGQKCTCIAYRNSRDLDVQFEDGTIVTNMQKTAFYSGKIGNPNFIVNIGEKLIVSCIGETRTMNNGQKCTCIAYRNNRDLDVQFEDGTIVTNKRKQHFVEGKIGNPNFKKIKSDLGE